MKFGESKMVLDDGYAVSVVRNIVGNEETRPWFKSVSF